MHDHDAIDEWLQFAPDGEPGGPRRVHPVVIVATVVAVLVVAGLVLLRPTGSSQVRAEQALSALGVPTEFHRANVAAVFEAPCDGSTDLTCVTVTFEILDGPDAGRTYVQTFSPGGTTPDFAEGQTAVLSYQPPNGRVESAEEAPCDFDPEIPCDRYVIVMTAGDVVGQRVEYLVPQGFETLVVGGDVEVTFDEAGDVIAATPSDISTQYQFADFERRLVLAAVLGLFAVAVIVLGRWKGVAALAGLGATLVIVLLWLLPAILDGRNPLLVALVGSAAVAFVALYVAHGFSLMTTIALLGTLSALVLTTALSAITVAAANFTGLVSEEATLLVLFEAIDIRGLLLAGMVLGAAGALDDVTVTQASSVWQLRRAKPDATFSELWSGGLVIGRDHIGSTVNTLLLAYLGASLPLAILFVLSQQSLGTIANSEVVAVEIVRTLVGSIGLVAAVPVTTWLAARVAAAADQDDSAEEKPSAVA